MGRLPDVEEVGDGNLKKHAGLGLLNHMYCITTENLGSGAKVYV
jgi:hypothetical protein